MDYQFPGLGPQFSQCFTTQFVGMEHLTPNEKALVEKAAAKRQRDFSTGRQCAKNALALLGLQAIEILQGEGKEPVWPMGITGSISHSKKMAGAVVVHSNEIVSIGLDIEVIGEISRDMWELLFTPNEQLFLNSIPSAEIPLFTTLIFSFKESFYKLQYPLTKLYVDFKDVEISYTDGHFSLKIGALFNYLLPFMNNLNLLWDRFDDQVICLMYQL